MITAEQMTLLRHTLATLAYRAAKVVRDAPPEFADFAAAPALRTPVQILAHMGDLFDWALSLAKGKQFWKTATPLAWNEELARFFASLEALDRHLGSGEPIGCSAEKLFQGPIADALTHTGQLAMLRHASGSKVRPENYFKAHITTGRAGADQAPPVLEY